MTWPLFLFFWKAITFSRLAKKRPLQVEDLITLPDDIKYSEFAPNEFALAHEKHPRFKFLMIQLRKQKMATLQTILSME